MYSQMDPVSWSSAVLLFSLLTEGTGTGTGEYHPYDTSESDTGIAVEDEQHLDRKLVRSFVYSFPQFSFYMQRRYSTSTSTWL